MYFLAQLPVAYSLDLSASRLLLSTSASRAFPHPGAMAGQTEAPRPVLTPQGSLIFNRLLLKMLLVGCPESPRVTLWDFSLSHQNPQLELQLVNADLGLSRWWDCLSPAWSPFRNGICFLSPCMAQLGFLLILVATVISSAL